MILAFKKTFRNQDDIQDEIQDDTQDDTQEDTVDTGTVDWEDPVDTLSVRQKLNKSGITTFAIANF